MAKSSDKGIPRYVGAQIRWARKKARLTQEQLAEPIFSTGYISAVERGAIIPSLKALEHIATKLGVSVSYLANNINLGLVQGGDSVRQGQQTTEAGKVYRVGLHQDPVVRAVQEDLNYQYNFARMLIRQGNVSTGSGTSPTDGIDEAFRVIAAAEQHAAPHIERLPPAIRYRSHFLRGLAYLQRSRPDLALPELERAHAEAEPDSVALATSGNMLGVAHFLSGHAVTALNYHRACFHAVESGAIKDLSLQLSILRNLANDYWSLRDIKQSIAIYKRALPLVEDLNGTERQASIYWALALSYRAANDWAEAKLYATRSLALYERLDDEAGAASVCLHLGEILTREGRLQEAQELLDKARSFIEHVGDPVLVSTLHIDYADLLNKKDALDEASLEAHTGLEIIREVIYQPQTAQTSKSPITSAIGALEREAPIGGGSLQTLPPVKAASPPINSITAYVEALQVSALIEERRGHQQVATDYYEEAKALALGTGLQDLAYNLVFSYAELLSKRDDYKQAAEHYKLAARLSGRWSVGHEI